MKSIPAAAHTGTTPRLRGFIFYPGGSAVWPQCWLCAVCAALWAVSAAVCGGGGVPCGGKHIIINTPLQEKGG